MEEIATFYWAAVWGAVGKRAPFPFGPGAEKEAKWEMGLVS